MAVAFGLALWCLIALPLRGYAQGATPCLTTPAVLTSSAPNIFNEKQEEDLGDALAEYFESELRIAAPAPHDELTGMGERLLAGLPKTGLHYRFRIYDSGEVNGFSLAGGRVYISRKLVAAVKNEDELAGVLAHEIGHLYTHQTATEITRILRVRLGISSVGDRADIFAKVHLMMSTPAKNGESGDKEEKNQLVADQVAFYAMVQAGYAPESFASFLNESMLNKGKTGNWLSDMFGLTHEAAQRYRSALKMVAELQPGCRNKAPLSSEAFNAWRKALVDERVKVEAGNATGDSPLKLEPPLRPGLWHVRFSPDGKRVLAQDETGITVVDYQAQKALFRIEAPDTEAAQFTPDSQNVVFHDENLRVERWDVSAGKRAFVKELVLFDGCRQTLLSKDGRTLVCLNLNMTMSAPSIDLRFIDVESGNVVLEKKNFNSTAWSEDYYAGLALEIANRYTGQLAGLFPSPDGRYLIVRSGGNLLAYDFTTRQVMTLGGKLKDLARRPFTFLDADEVFVIGDVKGTSFQTHTLTFPDGREVSQGQLGSVGMRPVSKGHLLTIGPLKDFAAAVYDPGSSKLLVTWKSSALDAWQDEFAGENSTGTLAVGQMGGAAKSMALPLAELRAPRAVAFSADGKYLAISLRTRAAIWNLETGTQVKLLRPMRSAWFDGQDQLYGQAPEYEKKDPQGFVLSMSPFGLKDLGKYEDKQAQFRELTVDFKPMSKGGGTDRHVTLEVKKMGGTEPVWTRDFPKDRPAVWSTEGDALLLGWDLGSDAGKAAVKGSAKLQQEASSFTNAKKGLLLEVVNRATGATEAQVALPEVDLTGGWHDERGAWVSGEFVLTRGEHGNTAIYRLADGKKVGEFFGLLLGTDAEKGLAVAVNREGEMILVEEKTGREVERFTLGSPIVSARIAGVKEKRLLVLTADQVVHRLGLP